jgi:hypothetical protein
MILAEVVEGLRRVRGRREYEAWIDMPVALVGSIQTHILYGNCYLETQHGSTSQPLGPRRCGTCCMSHRKLLLLRRCP